jgi:transposase InsO family protein
MTVDPFIEAEEVAGHSVQNACRLLEVSKSAYYQRRKGVPSRRALTDAELLEQIRAIHIESNGTYGAPRVHKELLHRHVACSRRKVTRLMRGAGLEGRCKKRWRQTTVVDPDADFARDLIQRHFGPCEEIDRRYVGDITYIATWEGWAYLATVIDLATRKVVGWAMAEHLRTALVTDALTMAFQHRAPEEGLIFHSDRGCQYTSRDFADLARANGVVLSVGRTGECWDNAVAESFFATIKRELIGTRVWPTRVGLRRALFEYIEGWYNTRRLHSTLGYLSPSQYEAVHHNASRQAA